MKKILLLDIPDLPHIELVNAVKTVVLVPIEDYVFTTSIRHFKEMLHSGYYDIIILNFEHPHFLNMRQHVVGDFIQNLKKHCPDEVIIFGCTDDEYQAICLKKLNIRILARRNERLVFKDWISGVEVIKKLVSEKMKVRLSLLNRKHGDRSISHARYISQYLSKRFTKATLTMIGQHFGYVTNCHASVIHSCKEVEDRMDTDAQYAITVNELITEIESLLFPSATMKVA